MIRPTRPEDAPALLALAEGTRFFKPVELKALREVLEDYHAKYAAEGHQAYAWESDGRIAGFVYFAPAAMTDRNWYLYWIFVDKPRQKRGIGAELLRHAEAEIRKQNGRLLLIETSGLPLYEPTRRFYRQHGYEQEARLRDFYAEGDDLILFRKRLDQSSS
jgi:ribosomal protein S18 acetylase RimI-like enzyme